MNELQFFNPYAEIRHTENRLPHWQQQSAIYFITFRLGDAIPAHLHNQWESERATWLQFHPQPWTAEIKLEYHKRFSGAIERWLDEGYGSCHLRRSDCAQIVAETLQHFDAERLALISSVVMPKSCARGFRAGSRSSDRKIAAKLENIYRAKDQWIARSFSQPLAAGLF